MGQIGLETASATARTIPESIVDRYRDRTASRLKQAARWCGLLICFLIVLELTCRVEDWVMYRMPIFSPYTSIEDLIVRDADGMHGRASAQYQKWAMNNLGLRGPAASVVAPPGLVRVITVGASETFGLMESANREYPRQLEDSLARRAPLACPLPPGGRFEVLNAGFAGMSLPTIEEDVRNRLDRLKPDIIVVYPSAAAYLDDNAPVAAKPDSAPVVRPSWTRALEPRILPRLREQLKQATPNFLKTWLRRRQTVAELGAQRADQFKSIPIDRLQQFDSDLQHLVGTIRQIGAIPILVTHGNAFMGRSTPDPDLLTAWEKFYPRATGQTLIAFDSAARIATLDIAAKTRTPVVDAAIPLSRGPLSAFGDMVHFTDLGSSEMANVLTGGVLDAARAAGRCGRAGWTPDKAQSR